MPHFLISDIIESTTAVSLKINNTGNINDAYLVEALDENGQVLNKTITKEVAKGSFGIFKIILELKQPVKITTIKVTSLINSFESKRFDFSSASSKK